MPATISAYIRKGPTDDLSALKPKSVAAKLSPEAYRFSGNSIIRDSNDNIVGTVFTNSRTDKPTYQPLRVRKLDLRQY